MTGKGSMQVPDVFEEQLVDCCNWKRTLYAKCDSISESITVRPLNLTVCIVER